MKWSDLKYIKLINIDNAINTTTSSSTSNSNIINRNYRNTFPLSNSFNGYIKSDLISNNYINIYKSEKEKVNSNGIKEININSVNSNGVNSNININNDLISMISKLESLVDSNNNETKLSNPTISTDLIDYHKILITRIYLTDLELDYINVKFNIFKSLYNINLLNIISYFFDNFNNDIDIISSNITLYDSNTINKHKVLVIIEFDNPKDYGFKLLSDIINDIKLNPTKIIDDQNIKILANLATYTLNYLSIAHDYGPYLDILLPDSIYILQYETKVLFNWSHLFWPNTSTKLSYMSPHGLSNTISNYASFDLWALGCILCELSFGKNIFQGSTKEEMLNENVFDEFNKIKFKSKLSELMHDFAMPTYLQILIFKLFSYPHVPAKKLLAEFTTAFKIDFKTLNDNKIDYNEVNKVLVGDNLKLIDNVAVDFDKENNHANKLKEEKDNIMDDNKTSIFGGIEFKPKYSEIKSNFSENVSNLYPTLFKKVDFNFDYDKYSSKADRSIDYIKEINRNSFEYKPIFNIPRRPKTNPKSTTAEKNEIEKNKVPKVSGILNKSNNMSNAVKGLLSKSNLKSNLKSPSKFHGYLPWMASKHESRRCPDKFIIHEVTGLLSPSLSSNPNRVEVTSLVETAPLQENQVKQFLVNESSLPELSISAGSPISTKQKIMASLLSPTLKSSSLPTTPISTKLSRSPSASRLIQSIPTISTLNLGEDIINVSEFATLDAFNISEVRSQASSYSISPSVSNNGKQISGFLKASVSKSSASPVLSDASDFTAVEVQHIDVKEVEMIQPLLISPISKSPMKSELEIISPQIKSPISKSPMKVRRFVSQPIISFFEPIESSIVEVQPPILLSPTFVRSGAKTAGTTPLSSPNIAEFKKVDSSSTPHLHQRHSSSTTTKKDEDYLKKRLSGTSSATYMVKVIPDESASVVIVNSSTTEKSQVIEDEEATVQIVRKPLESGRRKSMGDIPVRAFDDYSIHFELGTIPEVQISEPSNWYNIDKSISLMPTLPKIEKDANSPKYRNNMLSPKPKTDKKLSPLHLDIPEDSKLKPKSPLNKKFTSPSSSSRFNSPPRIKILTPKSSVKKVPMNFVSNSFSPKSIKNVPALEVNDESKFFQSVEMCLAKGFSNIKKPGIPLIFNKKISSLFVPKTIRENPILIPSSRNNFGIGTSKEVRISLDSCKNLNLTKFHSVAFATLLTDFEISFSSNNFIFPPDYSNYSSVSSSFNCEASFILSEEQINKEDKVAAILIFGADAPNSYIEDMKIVGLCKVELSFLSMFGPNEGWYHVYSYSDCISQRKLDIKSSIGQLKVTIYPADILSLLTNHGFKSYGSFHNDMFMLPKSSCDDDEWFRLMNLYFNGSCNIPIYLLKKVMNSKRSILPINQFDKEVNIPVESKTVDNIFNNYLNDFICHDVF